MKYKIIYADPPWSYDDKSLNRGGAERHYKTEGNDVLSLIDVNSIADDDCVLFMWATFPKIKEALELMEAWGFEYKTNAFTWVKKNKIKDSWFWGMGSWTRNNAEYCLLGVKGKPKRISKGIHSVVDTKIGDHSQKPFEVRSRIVELMGDIPRIELFARDSGDKDLFGKNRMDGWDVWGNEVKSDIEL